MLMTARYMPDEMTESIEGQLIVFQRGQFVFGRKSYSNKLCITEQKLRTLIKKMVDDNMISLVKTYNKFSVYNITNYWKYNPISNQQNNHQNNQQNNQQEPNSGAGFQSQATSRTTSTSTSTSTTYKNVKEKDIKPSRQKRVYDVEEIPYRSAKYLLDKIREHKPDLKEPDIQKWADTMRLLIERDKREPIKVAQVIDWCTNDSFWKTNILSADSLRNQWDKLTAKMDGEKSSSRQSQFKREASRGVTKPENTLIS